MSNRYVSTICHMQVHFDKDEQSLRDFKQWSDFFHKLEDYTRGSLEKPILERLSIDENRALSLLITGKDVFIGVYQHTEDLKHSLSSEIELSDLKSLSRKEISRMLDNINQTRNGTLHQMPRNMAAHWGKHLVRELSAENNLEKKMMLARAKNMTDSIGKDAKMLLVKEMESR